MMSINIIHKNKIGESRSISIKTMRAIETLQNKIDTIPALELEIPYFFISNAVIINKIANVGKTHFGNTLSDKDKNQRIIVSAKINPPIIRSNSEKIL